MMMGVSGSISRIASAARLWMARGDPPPGGDEVVGVLLVVAHRQVVDVVARARGGVEVHHDLDAVFLRQLQVLLQVVQAAVDVAVVVGEVAVAAHGVPIARHLEAREGGAPVVQHLEVRVFHAVPQHHAAQHGPVAHAVRVDAAVGGVGLGPERRDLVYLERGEVELHPTRAVLDAERDGAVAPDRVLVQVHEADGLPGEVAQDLRGAGVDHLSRLLILEAEHELEAFPFLGRGREAEAARADLGPEELAVEPREVVRQRGRPVRRLVGGYVHHDDVPLPVGEVVEPPFAGRAWIREGAHADACAREG